jgi:hypothetical protein
MWFNSFRPNCYIYSIIPMGGRLRVRTCLRSELWNTFLAILCYHKSVKSDSQAGITGMYVATIFVGLYDIS